MNFVDTNSLQLVRVSGHYVTRTIVSWGSQRYTPLPLFVAVNIHRDANPEKRVISFENIYVWLKIAPATG
jgi:hypothetical protein